MSLKKLTEHGIMVVGDTKYRGHAPSESAEQISFFQLLRMNHPELADIAFHVRNEGKRTRRQAEIEKLEGMNVGTCDIVIPCCPPILIELKKKGKPIRISGKQIKYLSSAKRAGAKVCVALSAADALEFVQLICLGDFQMQDG